LRQTATFSIQNIALWKRRLLHWAGRHTISACLDSNSFPDQRSYRTDWACLAAAGAAEVLECQAGTAFEQLEAWRNRQPDWLFGFFGYDLKNEVEALHSAHPDRTGWPDLAFFRPLTVAGIRNKCLEIHTLAGDPLHIKAEIEAAVLPLDAPGAPTTGPRVVLQPRMDRATYLHTVQIIRDHILRGDLYEMNFCQEFYAEKTQIDPLAICERLYRVGRAPFSTCFRWNDRYLLSASPERFLRKKGDRILTQPIKGTRPRGKTRDEDLTLQQDLQSNEKDRSENVMIVDLVRNDFARHCLPGTIRVEELFGIYAFATVHQMISTVSGQLPSGASGIAALRDAFPMGSMTGAPKIMAMQLAERYEKTRRGLYSGAFGYFDPAGDFDFNVVIRSILYNATAQYLSVHVGGAIVYDSVPEQEYEECLVKLRGIRTVLES
jgi:para-aminobenzoate synthetase component 1